MKTLIIPNKSKLYIRSQGVACNISATCHFMEYTTSSITTEETYREKIHYSVPQQNNVSTILDISQTSLKRIVRELYAYNNGNTAQLFSLRIRTYTDITLPAGIGTGYLDDTENFTDTTLLDFGIPPEKVWRLSEAFLLSYPSVIVLEEASIDEISIVVAPTGSQVLDPDVDEVHITMSHGEVQDSSEFLINERLDQKVVKGAGNFSIYKLPDTPRNPSATVIKQIAVYNNSTKTVHIRVGFGPATSSDLQSYVFDGDLAPNKSWFSDANTFQSEPVGSGSTNLSATLPLDYNSNSGILRISQVGAANRQVLGWDDTSMQWLPQDSNELLTPIAPLQYNFDTLEMFIDGSTAVAGDVLTWKESTLNANDFAWRPSVGGSGGSGGSGGGCGGGIPNRNLIIDGDFFYGSV